MSKANCAAFEKEKKATPDKRVRCIICGSRREIKYMAGTNNKYNVPTNRSVKFEFPAYYRKIYYYCNKGGCTTQLNMF